MNGLDIAAAQSAWARRNVGEKILLFGGLLVLAVALPPWPFAPIIGAIAFSAVLVARVRLRLYVLMVLAPLSFVVVGSLPLLVAIGPSGLMMSPSGPMRVAEVILRSGASVACTMGFALTTPMAELLAWLGRHGVPRFLVYLAEVIYRMAGALIASARSMSDAQARRLGALSRRAQLRDIAGQSANLFALAFIRARLMQQGIELRAEPGAMQVAVISRPRELRFVMLTIAILAVLLAAAGWQRWGS